MRLWGSIRSMRPAEIAGRLGEVLRTSAERIGDPGRLLDGSYRTAGTEVPAPRLPYASLMDIERTVSLWLEHHPGSAARTVDIAAGVLEGRIPLFSDVVDFGSSVDWHLDPVTGTRAPLDFYRDIDTLDPAVTGDVKFIWELNRCNFFVTLGRAYAVTGERRFYEGWRRLFTGWIDANPYNRGVNWESSLELAIRAANWLWSGCLFAPELERDEEARERLLHTLALHGRHIERHLSRWFSPNTHLTGEALGLLLLSSAYRSALPARRWARIAEDILETELQRQILPDGGYFEMATWYHKYTVDFYLHYLILSGRAGAESRAAIGKAVRHLALLAGPDGTIPLLGDSDGGRLLDLSPAKESVLGACAAAAVLLGDGSLKALSRGIFDEESLWLLGGEGHDRFSDLPTEEPETWHSVNTETGLFCFRTGIGEKDVSLVIDCGPHGWGNCGHAHSDMLSIVLSAGGGQVLTDPGTYVYSADMGIRDATRRSQSHNTITVGGVSQSVPGEVFRWKSIAHPRGVFCRASGAIGYFEGGHDGYDHLGCRHVRIVLYFGGLFSVAVDLVRAFRQVESILHNLQFAGGRLDSIGGGVYRFEHAQGAFFVRVDTDMDTAIDAGEGDIYPDYHRAVRAPRLRLLEREVSGARRIVTLLSERRDIVQCLEWERPGLVHGEAGGSAFAIRVDEADAANDGGEPRVSSFVRDGDQIHAVLRNVSEASERDGTGRIETAEPVPFIGAQWEEGTLRLSSAGRLPPLRASEEIDELIVNGSRVAFERRDGWIQMVT